jgi:hypothetical protein
VVPWPLVGLGDVCDLDLDTLDSVLVAPSIFYKT